MIQKISSGQIHPLLCFLDFIMVHAKIWGEKNIIMIIRLRFQILRIHRKYLSRKNNHPSDPTLILYLLTKI